MSIVWGPGWFAFSDKALVYDEDQEKMYVDDMIANCADERVQAYYFSNDGGQVYVKAGRHSSDSERRVHITLQLGLNQHPYESHEWPARTAHVIDIQAGNQKYPADVFAGFTKDSKKKINSI